VASCNEVAKYFYTVAHLQYVVVVVVVVVGVGVVVVEISFIALLNGRSGAHKLCIHFLRFLFIYLAIRALIVAPPSGNFENCSIGCKGLSFRKKRCIPHLNRPTNADAMSCGSNSTTHSPALFSTTKIERK